MGLAQDSHLYVLPLLDEEPASYEISHVLEVFDNGHVASELEAPDNNENRVLTFAGISASEELYPTLAQKKLRRLLNAYASGKQLRVFRLYPSVVTAWSQTNYFGYSDIVADSLSTMSYNWNNPAMTQHEFKLSGVDVT